MLRKSKNVVSRAKVSLGAKVNMENQTVEDNDTEVNWSDWRIEVKTDKLETLETCLSSWNKMRKVFALVLKFKTNLLRKAFPKRDTTVLHQQTGTFEQLLSIVEIEIAGKKLINVAQNRAFAEELSWLGLTNNKKVAKEKQKSKLYLLDPFVDEKQVLSVGGRLTNSSSNISSTHAIQLSNNGTFTELPIRHCHENTAHGGIDITWSEIRSNGYWIIDANSKTIQIIYKYVRCWSLRGRLGEQKTYHTRELQKSLLLLIVALICLDHSISRRRDQNSRNMEQCFCSWQVELFTYRWLIK